MGTFVSLSIPNAKLWMWVSVVSNLRVHYIQLIRQWISEVLIRVHRLVMDAHAQYAVEIEQFRQKCLLIPVDFFLTTANIGVVSCPIFAITSQ